MKQRIPKPSHLWGIDAASRRVVQPAEQPLPSVTEITIYPQDFTRFLRDRMQGKTLEEVAEILRVPPKEAKLYLQGNWRPTQGLLQRLGLMVVYAASDLPPVQKPQAAE